MSGWDESKHPRVPGGKVNGGQFTEKEMDTAVGAARAREEPAKFSQALS